MSTSGTLFLLVSEGNGPEMYGLNFVFNPEATSSQTISMHTTSFSDSSNFYQWRWDPAEGNDYIFEQKKRFQKRIQFFINKLKIGMKQVQTYI